MSQLLVKGGTCITASSRFIADVLIDDEHIVAIAQNLTNPTGEIIDAHGCYVLPGGIDVHTHMPWPTGSNISLDSINNGTKSAAHGGVTTVLDFAIPNENHSLANILEEKILEAKTNAWVDYSFHLNIRGEVEKKLSEINDLVGNGFPSFKIFMAYEGFRLSEREILIVMERVKQADGILTVHAENGQLADHLTKRLIDSGKTSPANYPLSRPEVCETEAIFRILSFDRLIGTRLHIHHVSTARGAELINFARKEGLPVSGETCPHYLLLNSYGYMGTPSEASYMICAPSIKSLTDQAALWRHLSIRSLSILATDHCPYSRIQKEEHLDNFSLIPGGIAGVELRLPLIFTQGVNNGRLSLERFVEIWATAPAKIFGLYPRKGSIQIGSDADLVILDPRKKGVIAQDNLHMNTDCSPFYGMEVIGLSPITILRGQILINKGELVSPKPTGQLIPRKLITTL